MSFGNFGQYIRETNLPEAGSTFAGPNDDTFVLIYLVSIFFFALITGAVLWFCLRYRRRPGQQVPPRILDHTILEATWTIVPTIIVFWLFWIGARNYYDMQVPPANSIEVEVSAQQWKWTFIYPAARGRKDAQLWIPVNTPVKLSMRSADVIHSLFIPAFRVKNDINLNRISELWFKANKLTDEGKPHRIYCAEHCGQDHSRMTSWVHVLDKQSWHKKMDEISKKIVGGEELFLENCASCHSTMGKVITGPALNDIWGKMEDLEDGRSVLVDEAYFRKSLLAPNVDVVKGFAGQKMTLIKLEEEEIVNLMNYIKSLTPGVE